jgi:endonuclease/exonuclease/phosphatase family metal-dependent hydrolase
MAIPEILTGSFAPFKLALWPPRSLRIVDWNINRGQELQGVIEFFASSKADVLILQEMDLNARRTHRLNIAEEIARRLEMNYVFGREFEELVQGSKSSPAYHGQAILSKWPISNPRLIRFSKQSNFWQPHWFLPRIEPFQERRGGRIALVAEINVPGSRLVIYDLHLESRGNDELRTSQLREVLSDANCWDTDCPVIIAGDFNLDASESAVATAVLSSAAFKDAVAATRTPTTPSRRLFEAGRRIDWAFIRGPIRAIDGRVHNQVKVSDHYPISFTTIG